MDTGVQWTMNAKVPTASANAAVIPALRSWRRVRHVPTTATARVVFADGIGGFSVGVVIDAQWMDKFVSSQKQLRCHSVIWFHTNCYEVV